MPMNWNSDADAKLLIGIVNYTDFKLNKETLAKLNKWMGPDCVGQSISQRLIKLKKKFYDANPGLVGATIPEAGDTTPKTPRTGIKRKQAVDDDGDEAITPTPKRRAGRPKKADKAENAEGAGEDGVPATLTPKKRGRPKKADLEAAKLAKDNAMIKKEPGSDSESKTDSVIQNTHVAEQLLAAAEDFGSGYGSDKEPEIPRPDSDDEA